MLLFTAPWRLAVAPSFIDTAKPPASSAGLTMREPLDNRFRLFCSRLLELAKLLEAVVAD
jgi:hypothetical protein